MSDEPIERRKVTWQSEIERLETAFKAHYEIDEQMHTETNDHMKIIREKLESIEGVITAWNNVKGFAVIMKGVGTFMKWTVGIGAALGTIWWSLHGQHKP